MTKIQWTDETSNPIYLLNSGKNNGHWCRKISEGCLNCYAETINNNNRFSFASHLSYSGKPPENLFLDKDILISWVKARKPKLVFPFSMTDWCGDWIPIEWNMNILDSMAASRLNFQTLTKRADRLKAVCDHWLKTRKLDKIPPNIWVGITAENQERFDERIKYLIDIPCYIRWLSLEPLLGWIELFDYREFIDWVVVGGESGKNARECHIEWIERIALDMESRIFVKQLGYNIVYCWEKYKTKHPKGGDFEEFPKSVKIRKTLPIIECSPIIYYT